MVLAKMNHLFIFIWLINFSDGGFVANAFHQGRVSLGDIHRTSRDWPTNRVESPRISLGTLSSQDDINQNLIIDANRIELAFSSKVRVYQALIPVSETQTKSLKDSVFGALKDKIKVSIFGALMDKKKVSVFGALMENLASLECLSLKSITVERILNDMSFLTIAVERTLSNMSYYAFESCERLDLPGCLQQIGTVSIEQQTMSMTVERILSHMSLQSIAVEQALGNTSHVFELCERFNLPGCLLLQQIGTYSIVLPQIKKSIALSNMTPAFKSRERLDLPGCSQQQIGTFLIVHQPMSITDESNIRDMSNKSISFTDKSKQSFAVERSFSIMSQQQIGKPVQTKRVIESIAPEQTQMSFLASEGDIRLSPSVIHVKEKSKLTQLPAVPTTHQVHMQIKRNGRLSNPIGKSTPSSAISRIQPCNFSSTEHSVTRL